ncbi:MAG TPA: hypothetical protein VLI55_06190 [Bryobacteraceae bacterium]|nr:hypothetical protein [Bryobacteraceae bacterium]
MLRQALDDVGEQPRFVETVIGKGYRFIADISAPTPLKDGTTLPHEPAPAKRRAYLFSSMEWGRGLSSV